MNSLNIQTIGRGKMSGCKNVTLTSNIKVIVQMHLIHDMAKNIDRIGLVLACTHIISYVKQIVTLTFKVKVMLTMQLDIRTE